MTDKNKTQLALTLLTSLISSSIVVDKDSALEIISLMKEMVQKGF